LKRQTSEDILIFSKEKNKFLIIDLLKRTFAKKTWWVKNRFSRNELILSSPMFFIKHDEVFYSAKTCKKKQGRLQSKQKQCMVSFYFHLTEEFRKKKSFTVWQNVF
jgi:hypothetical protein